MALQHPLIPAPANQPNDNPPAPATGLTTADLARLRHSLDSSVSDNTRKMYATPPGAPLRPGPRPAAPWPCRLPRL